MAGRTLERQLGPKHLLALLVPLGPLGLLVPGFQLLLALPPRMVLVVQGFRVLPADPELPDAPAFPGYEVPAH